MKRKLLIMMIFISLASSIEALAEDIVLTLDETIAIALRDNRDILLKRQDLEKAKLKISQARGALLPAAIISGARDYTRGFYPKDIGVTSFRAGLTQFLYKGGQIINTIQYNGHLFEVSQAVLDKQKLESVLSVQKAFFALALAGRFLDLNKAVFADSSAQLTYIMDLYKNGKASESDVLKAQGSLENVSKALEDSFNQVESGRVILQNLLYLAKDTQVTVQTEFTYDLLELVFDEGFLRAMERRPEIKQYDAQGEADKKAVEIAKAGNRPSIYASWDYYSRSTTQLTFSPTKGWNDYNAIGLTVSWPIFDGWTTKAKVEQALVDLKETRLLKEKAIQDIALELKTAYLALKNAVAKIRAAEQDLLIYRDNLSTALAKYQDGQASHLDISQAELKYKISLFNKNDAVYDYIIAKYSFEKATGGV